MTREQKLKYSVLTALLAQIVSAVCGFIVPRLLVDAFGSELYGATTSIAQFLSYITLLEGGIGTVARAALYKPLADNNNDVVSDIYYEIQSFFRIIAYVFLGYTILLSIGYKYIAHLSTYDLPFVASLVIVISLSTIAQYYFGITNSIVIQADQRQYINNIATIITTIINTILIIIILLFDVNIIVVKFASSMAYLIKPFILTLYIKKNYVIKKRQKNIGSDHYLTQKGSAFGQHIAYFVNSNTDIFILTLFNSVTSVAVYSIYLLIVSTIRNIVLSFSNGMEAFFGNMLAKKENVNKEFVFYETFESIIATIFFSTTAILITPFVGLYMKGVTDANYYQPVFSLFLVIAYYAYCLREPYGAIVFAAGHIKSTQKGAYGEAIINILVSILLVIRFGLVGVAIGTLVAMIFRTVYYAFYISGKILNRPFSMFIKRQIINIFAFALIVFLGMSFKSLLFINSFIDWLFFAIMIFVFSIIFTVLINLIFYKKYTRETISYFIGKVKK